MSPFEEPQCGSTSIYMPSRVTVTHSGEVELELLYAIKAEFSADLRTAPLQQDSCRTTVFEKVVLGCFEAEEGGSPCCTNITVQSYFNLSDSFKYARFYLYGFVPSDGCRSEKKHVTKEYGFNGCYLREYYNLHCMVTSACILEYDGIEQGVFRLNSDFSMGREIGDMYTGVLTGKRWWVVLDSSYY